MRKVIISLVVLSGVFFACLAIVIILVLQKAKEIDWTIDSGTTEVRDDASEVGETDMPGTETRGDDELSEEGIFDEDFETTLMADRYALVNDQRCISGDAMSSFNTDPIIADLEADDVADLTARLESILGDGEDADALYEALKTIDKPVTRLCAVSDDLTVVLTRMFFPVEGGGTQYRYDLFILPKDVFDEFSVEEGDALYGGANVSVVLWRDIDPSSISELPAVAVFEEGPFEVETWDVYAIDTFFGEFDHIESCAVTGVGGVKKIACDKIYE